VVLARADPEVGCRRPASLSHRSSATAPGSLHGAGPDRTYARPPRRCRLVPPTRSNGRPGRPAV